MNCWFFFFNSIKGIYTQTKKVSNYDTSIPKTTIYRIINRFGQIRLAGDHPRSGRQKNLTPLEERFIPIASRREKCLPANPQNWEMFLVRKYPPKSSEAVSNARGRMVKILTFCPFQNIFYDRDTALHTNEILQRCMQDLTLIYLKKSYKACNNFDMGSVINRHICDMLLNFNVSVYNLNNLYLSVINR